MTMKKIIVYLDSMTPSGGKERVVANLLNSWSNIYDLTLLVKDSGESFYSFPDNIKIKSIDTPLILDMNNRTSRILAVFKNMIVSTIRLKKFLKKEEYDYIYTSTPQNSMEAFLAMKNASRKLVVSEHAYIHSFNKIYSAMKKYVYPRAYCISVPNKSDTDEYKAWGCNSVFIPHPVTYHALEKNKLDSKLVLNVGRLTADKQQEKLIRIWQKIEKRDNWKLCIVGSGEEYHKLKQIIQDDGLFESVNLLDSRKDIASIYKQASIFALSSRVEGFGMVLLEAMSFGIPCISFDCPSGPRDVVKDGYNGFLIENMNDDEYARKLQIMILMSNTELQKIGNNAFETVKNWDNEGILAKWNLVFK